MYASGSMSVMEKNGFRCCFDVPRPQHWRRCKSNEEGRTHVLDLSAAHGVNEGDSEPVAGDGAEARGDGVPGRGLEHLVVHLLRALAGAGVVAPEGRDLRTSTETPSAQCH